LCGGAVSTQIIRAAATAPRAGRHEALATSQKQDIFPVANFAFAVRKLLVGEKLAGDALSCAEESRAIPPIPAG
jgi:hypothetical protein